MGGVDNGLGLRCRQTFEKLATEILFVFAFGRQMPLHGADKAPGRETQRLQILGALFGRNGGIVIKAGSHADQIAGVVNVHSPVLSRFVPTLVGRVGTEDEQQTERGTGERKGRQRQGHQGSPYAFNKRRVLDTFQVCVSSHQAVIQDDEGRNSRRCQDFLGERLVHTRRANGEKVAQESIRRAVLDPIIVRVHGTTVFA
mmetsp:Transcript_46300/g.122218  ORF Transcript_46300/g.122218 Transcript_46300/m.122218 type:complete len:200 (-) Transcript_46300:246-845(-)